MGNNYDIDISKHQRTVIITVTWL